MTYNRPGPCIENQIVDGYEGTAETRGLAAAQHAPNSCQELNRSKRLGNVVVRTGFKATDLVRYGCPCSEHDDGNTALLPDFAENTEAVAVWQHDVKDDEYDPAFFRPVEACLCSMRQVNRI